jgi:threonine/homoserine/homoserine lactone efflux protein
MEPTSLLIFSGALLIAAGSPGPSVAALVARVISRGWRDVIPFVVAMWVGEAIWLTMAVFGLATLASELNWAFVLLKYAGVAYLLYLAWKMWRAPAEIRSDDSTRLKGSGLEMFFTGLAVTMGNPKIMIFYLALLPTIIELNGISMMAWAELGLTMLVVLAFIDLGYVALAARARLIMKSPRALRLSNKISASVMGAAAGAIAFRQNSI